MTAAIDNNFSVRPPIWYEPKGEFSVVEYPNDWEDARTRADLAWEPKIVPSYTRTVALDENGVSEQYDEVEGTRFITRDDTGAVLVPVGPGYTPVGNGALGEFAEALFEENNSETKIVTAGHVDGGKLVWMLLQVAEPFVFAGDDSPTYPYLALMNGHGGSSFYAMPTEHRIVCRNIYRAAELAGKNKPTTFKFRHTGSVMDRVDEARHTLRGVKEDTLAAQELAAGLASIPASENAYLDFVAMFLPDPAERGEQVSDRVRENISRARGVLDRIYNGPTCDGNRGSALGLVHASVEYLDHMRGYRSQTKYLKRTVLQPEELKARAVRQAREACLALA